MTILSIDFETYSAVDLTRAGVYKYAADPSTGIWCMAYAFDDEPVQLWDEREPIPARVIEHLHRNGVFRAWNAQFERVVWDHCLMPIVGMAPGQHSWYCTAAEAAAMSLPRHLGKAAEVLGVTAKDSEGAQLMRKMSVAGYEPTEDELQRLFDYCKNDVVVEREIFKKTRRLDSTEQNVYWLDQRINDRGVAIDRPLVIAARRIVSQEVAKAGQTLFDLTNGEVGKATQVPALKRWLKDRGIETKSLNKATVHELLTTGTIPDDVRDVLLARQDAGKSSVAKLDGMLTVAGDDGVMRGLLLYHGASTGRWAGKLVQPQNFPRGTVKVTPEVLDRIRAGTANMAEVSSALRGMLIAKPGKRLYVADYSAIEARVLAWVSGDAPALEDFRAGRDPYKVMATYIFGCTYDEVTPEQRQTGKAAVLGLGYQMGAKKFVSAAWDVYQVRVDPEQSPGIVKAYRALHPAVKTFWSDVQNAAMDAVRNPGATFLAGRYVKFVMKGQFLWCILPSKRPLCYPLPKIVMGIPPWEREKIEAGEITVAEAERVEQLSFGAEVGPSRQWGRETTYGGKLTENIVQAISRDIMADRMRAVEAAGFEPILSVHDEVISERDARDSGHGDEVFNGLYLAGLTMTPAWAEGLPLKVEGWHGTRYRK
jgi:DNA polymerase